jgi:tetratricopeptide (TPR) repeat protein
MLLSGLRFLAHLMGGDLMSISLNKISLRGCMAGFWRQVTGCQPKQTARQNRRIDFQGLYWMTGLDANQKCDPGSSLDGWMRDDASSADYWYMRGEDLVRKEHLSEADDCFDRALKQDPRDACALIYRGYCLYRLGSYEAACAYLGQAAQLEPRQPEIGIIKALCLCHLQQFEEALRHFTRALRCGLETPDIWNNKGFCLARLGRHREASAALKNALSKCGADSLEILCNAASVLVKLGAGKQALDYFDQALKVNADDHVLLNNVAFCLERLGRCDQAIKCYEKALSLDPGNPTYLYNQGLCLLKLQRWDRACERLKEAVGRDPGNGIAWCGLAAASLARGNADEALDFYNRALAPTG